MTAAAFGRAGRILAGRQAEAQALGAEIAELLAAVAEFDDEDEEERAQLLAELDRIIHGHDEEEGEDDDT